MNIYRRNKDELIPNDQLREICEAIVEREGISWTQLAARAGYYKSSNNKNGRGGDPTTLRRKLGIIPFHTRGGKGRYLQRNVTPEVAEYICRNLDLDPVDIGL